MKHSRLLTLIGATRVLTSCGLALCLARAEQPAAEPLSPERFAAVFTLIKPQANESQWANIPWLTNLHEARKKAVDEDRPLLVWRAGGGDVLGRA
jgi:hypothetical protein